MLFRSAILLLLIVGLVSPQALLSRKQQSKENARRRQAQAELVSKGGSADEDEGETSDQCPEPNGYFADAEQCDKYYDCRDGVITEKLCPDGMVFNDYDPQVEKCDLPLNLDCSQRPKLQEPSPALHCRRQHGYFPHEDPTNCVTFYYCVDGKFNMITCPDGLVFNEKTGICTWPDESKKKGCGSKDVFNFTCPKVDEMEAQTHPRYADPEDCQFFYVCINGDTPRRNGCKLGQAFDESSKRCNWARKVPECKDWYKDTLTDADLEALENPPTRKPATSRPNRRRPSRPSKTTKVVTEAIDDDISEDYETSH